MRGTLERTGQATLTSPRAVVVLVGAVVLVAGLLLSASPRCAFVDRFASVVAIHQGADERPSCSRCESATRDDLPAVAAWPSVQARWFLRAADGTSLTERIRRAAREPAFERLYLRLRVLRD